MGAGWNGQLGVGWVLDSPETTAVQQGTPMHISPGQAGMLIWVLAMAANAWGVSALTAIHCDRLVLESISSQSPSATDQGEARFVYRDRRMSVWLLLAPLPPSVAAVVTTVHLEYSWWHRVLGSPSLTYTALRFFSSVEIV